MNLPDSFKIAGYAMLVTSGPVFALEQLAGKNAGWRRQIAGDLGGIIIAAESGIRFRDFGAMAEGFDMVFGNRFRSLRFWGASLVWSIVTVSLIYFAAILFGPPPGKEWASFKVASFAFMIVSISAIVYNWAADGASLIVTRFVLGRMLQAESGVMLIVWWCIDLIASAVLIGVAIAGVAVPAYVLHVHPLGGTNEEKTFWGFYSHSMLDNLYFRKPGAVCFYASFITSVWIWGSVAGYYLTKWFLRGVRFIAPRIDPVYLEKPFLCVGAMVAALTYISVFIIAYNYV
jgi:hypothetical protein